MFVGHYISAVDPVFDAIWRLLFGLDGIVLWVRANFGPQLLSRIHIFQFIHSVRKYWIWLITIGLHESLSKSQAFNKRSLLSSPPIPLQTSLQAMKAWPSMLNRPFLEKIINFNTLLAPIRSTFPTFQNFQAHQIPLLLCTRGVHSSQAILRTPCQPPWPPELFCYAPCTYRISYGHTLCIS
jgi:hypothetical protein